MTASPHTTAPVHGPAVEAGPILSLRDGDTTTVWRDGEVVRELRNGRVVSMPATAPVFGERQER